MSGAQIGTVVGGVIGAFFGAPQLGMAVGGLVGGAIDPTQVKGPHIGDGQTQTAEDGVPIAWVMGQARIAGTICIAGPRREKKKKDNGKGGQEVVTYYALQDFAILICESDSNRDSHVRSISVVEQDGQIVYDVRPGSTILEQSKEWVEGFEFYYGDEDQMPPSVLEAITGIGNCPAYRGVCLMVAKDFNVTNANDRIPTFRFVVGAGASSPEIKYDDYFKYNVTANPTIGEDEYPLPAYDDSAWFVGRGGFGTTFETKDPSYKVNTWVPADFQNKTIWLRKHFHVASPEEVDFLLLADDLASLWWNGEKIVDSSPAFIGSAGVEASKVLPDNVVVMRVTDANPPSENNAIFAAMTAQTAGAKPPEEGTYLGDIVRAVCKRGGLDPTYVDATELDGIQVQGYPIAVVATATDCLAPLLAAYFAYGSEYDNTLNFRLYGADAVLTVNPLDVVESDSGDDGASIVAEDREQATEYPRKITGGYYDPTQYFTDTNVTYERNSIDVVATGEQQLDIPVVMAKEDALKAIVKALKVAYASLEGTREYSLPYVGHDGEPYLTIAAGDPILFQGKRWVVNEFTIQANELHLKTTYSRQSAYTTNVQAIPSVPAVPPSVGFTGDTTFYVMNLPSLRPQDTYGVYITAGGAEGWPGCVIEVSFDGGQTWQLALTVGENSDLGALTTALPAGADAFSVSVTGELSGVGPDQIAAGLNAAVILTADDRPEILQFMITTETAVGAYDLSQLTRGGKGTTVVDHAVGERFTMLDAVYFYPIDLQYGGDTLQFRATTGSAASPGPVVSIVYDPDDTVILDGGGDPL